MSGQAETAIALPPLVRHAIDVKDEDARKFLHLTGFFAPEPQGWWSDGPDASLTFRLPEDVRDGIVLKLLVGAFVRPEGVPEQRVILKVNGVPFGQWQIQDSLARLRVLFLESDMIAKSKIVKIDFELPGCASPKSCGINSDQRRLAILLQGLTWEAVDGRPGPDSSLWQLGRPVGGEARKSFDQKTECGFWSRFVTGPKVLDIGFRGKRSDNVLPITDGAIGVDLDYPGYNGVVLPFADSSQDAVFSSHCLEHIGNYVKSIQEWYRVIRIGGHIIVAVPSAYLYERGRRPPSRWNQSHLRFYTPASLLGEFEAALVPNSYRVRYLEENDLNYNYKSDPEKHPGGCYEIVLVIEKIEAPSWTLRD